MNFNIQIDKEDLECCICSDDLISEIFTCVNGNHYVCLSCKQKIKKCPICNNTEGLVRHSFLEKNIKNSIEVCPKNCGKRFFSWKKDEHLETCSMNDITCFCCKRPITPIPSSILYHLDNFCDIKWTANNFTTSDGNISFFMSDFKDKYYYFNIENLVWILIYIKNEEYNISAVSTFEYLISTEIKLQFEETNVSFKIKPINKIFDFLTIPKNYGDKFKLIIEKIVETNPISNNNSNNNFWDMLENVVRTSSTQNTSSNTTTTQNTSTGNAELQNLATSLVDNVTNDPIVATIATHIINGLFQNGLFDNIRNQR